MYFVCWLYIRNWASCTYIEGRDVPNLKKQNSTGGDRQCAEKNNNDSDDVNRNGDHGDDEDDSQVLSI